MQIADPAIEMDADVGAHVLRADLQYAVLVDPARVRPLGDDVVDDALAQVLRHRVLGGVSRVIYCSRVAFIHCIYSYTSVDFFCGKIMAMEFCFCF